MLFVGTHRNGALDAAPYVATVPDAIPMVSAQLHRLPLGRLLFAGIAVSRPKDRARGIEADNLEAMGQCLGVLKEGGQLLIMPEGTSTLGPRHLPLQRGAAWIGAAALEAGIAPLIVPLGVHYEDPTAWQSRVEVLVGEAIRPAAGDTARAIHQRITEGLEVVGANFADEEEQRRAEALAYACTLGTTVSYAQALKRFERDMPPDLLGIGGELDRIARQERLCRHQGIPLMPVGPWPLYAGYWLILAPLVALFSLLNAPVLFAGVVASQKLPDDRNVISFWRMVIGLPAALVWTAVVSLLIICWSGPIGGIAYWFITVAGVVVWYRFRKLSIALCNGLCHAAARQPLLAAYRTLMRCLSDETSP
ncbi:hypothetical protein GHYDROH2_03620 [Geobacter hydrogenophilus]|uniref:Phospholipid/glycerol acyltransferase domain-containing protein n=1 Tax=Geobacter hydrogenophilus TaxID=40983 RepID=A0A9W6FXT0_9BACT|nr:hypothetical protein GHYDROH2_03620 [Geobacter hydrogenophilus]